MGPPIWSARVAEHACPVRRAQLLLDNSPVRCPEVFSSAARESRGDAPAWHKPAGRQERDDGPRGFSLAVVGRGPRECVEISPRERVGTLPPNGGVRSPDPPEPQPRRDVQVLLTAWVRATGAPIEKYRYLIIGRGSIELQFWDAPDVDPLTTDASCYIRVDDADALHREWKGVGIQSDPATGSRLMPPVDTDYGIREFALVDQSGNLLRVGSPLGRLSAVGDQASAPGSSGSSGACDAPNSVRGG